MSRMKSDDCSQPTAPQFLAVWRPARRRASRPARAVAERPPGPRVQSATLRSTRGEPIVRRPACDAPLEDSRPCPTCASPARRSRRRSQLPVRSYFDPDLFARERKRLFGAARATSATSWPVPELGDYYALPQEGEGRALVRTPDGLQLISNVCRHRQAVMLRAAATPAANIVCPLHRWTYDLDGQLIGAPHFADDPCLNLANYPLQTWNGMVFDGPAAGAARDVAAELAGLGPTADLDFSGYVFDSVKLHECDYNWKTFIEVYLEDYHVAPFHPGLGQFVTCEDLRWEFGAAPLGADGRAQERARQAGLARLPQVARRRARLPRGPLRRPGAAPRRDLADLLPGDDGRVVPARAGRLDAGSRGAAEDAQRRRVLLPRGHRAFEREFVEAEQAAYWETCAEDDEIALRMDAGRRALLERGDDEFGPYQSPMEDGMQQFHEWYRKAMR